jgi:catechol 2,3-dioxygenase-like lactoylglutathione lyase family enzyme
MVFLSTPGTDDLITLNQDDAEREQAGRSGGISHFGFKLQPGSDLDAAAREVERGGGRMVSRGEHVPGVPFVYVSDPDGYLIELGNP